MAHLGRLPQSSGVRADTVVLPGIRTLCSKYKGVLLDQFGVLHDGKVAYPGAVEAVSEMSAAGLQLYILSNSSRQAGGALKKIASLGFEESWFAGVMTSGEVTHRALAERPDSAWQTLGTRCIHFTWGDRGAVDISALRLQVVTSPLQADFILAHGTEGMADGGGALLPCSLQEFQAILRECAAVGGLPMVVANPDFVTVDGDALRMMPGTLAQYYASLGGEVRLMGKPATVIYEAAMKDLQLPACDVVAIGDSMEHDIAGAHAASVATVLVAGGIHVSELLPRGNGQELDAAHVMEWCTTRFPEVGPPTFAMPYLTW